MTEVRTDQDSAKVASDKKAYVMPKLVELGDLRTLTQAAMSNAVEGMGNAAVMRA